MRYIGIKKGLVVMLGLLAFLATSCINENLDECAKLTLRVNNHLGEDITGSGVASTVSLFIYDENMKHLETRQLDVDFIKSSQPIELNYPNGHKLNIVAWGNLRGKQTVTEADKLDDLKVMLKSSNSLAQSPDSLFYGSKEVVAFGGGIAGESQQIVINPKIGAIEMETIGLDKYLGKTKGLKSTGEFDFYMDRTLSGFDHKGELTGDSVYYNPDYVNSGKNNYDIITAEKDNVVSGENLTFRLSLGGEEFSVTKDDDGKPFTTTPFNLTRAQFLFNEDGLISVRVTVTPWGVVDDDHEF